MTDLLDKAKKEGTQPNPLYQAKAESTQSAQGKEEHASLKEQMDTPTVAEEYQHADDNPTTAEVDPVHKPLNKPLGSTGEAEQDIDVHPKDPD